VYIIIHEQVLNIGIAYVYNKLLYILNTIATTDYGIV